MTAPRHDGQARWAWRLTGLVTVLVYVFLFAPIVATVVLSFNASMFGGFPMTGLSLQWYGKLFQNESVLRAFKTSIWIAILTALIIIVAFVCAMFSVAHEYGVAMLFIGALVLFCLSLFDLARETRIALHDNDLRM